MRNYILFGFILFILLQSCDYGVLYELPQPINSRNLQSFPGKLLGTYFDDSSNVDVIIEKNRIIKISRYDIVASKAEIDTLPDCKLIGDSLFLADVQQFIKVHIINDSVFGVLATPDTLFTISQYNILRQLKKNYFLSITHESGFWQVIKLNRNPTGCIEFSVVPQSVDFELLNGITPVEQLRDQSDSLLNYKISPTAKQLETMIKADLFSKKEIYQSRHTE